MNRTILLIALAAIPVGCGDPAGPREWEPVEFSTPAIEGDTVDAILPNPVVVTVRLPDGQPVPNARVAFQTTNGYVTGGQAGFDWLRAWYARTDTDGRAAVRYRLGSSTTEPARLTVRTSVDEAVLELNVHPGAPVGLRAFPAETAVAVMDTYTPAVLPVDRHGNPRPGAIAATFSLRQTDVAQVDGSDLTIVAPGKAIIDWSADGLDGTAIVYGMPPGRLAIASRDGIDVFDMGTGSLQHIADEPSGCVRWHPDGERMLRENLVIVQATGEAARVPTGNDSIVAGCGEFTADGAWIFFEGRRATEDTWFIWRIRPDGTQLEQITAGHGTMPSPSPDGTRVAFRRKGVLYANVQWVVVATVGSAALDTISPPINYCYLDAICAGGITALRWSPTGEWIAYATKSQELRGGGRTSARPGTAVWYASSALTEPRHDTSDPPAASRTITASGETSAGHRMVNGFSVHRSWIRGSVSFTSHRAGRCC
ncbi:MAG TPA: hypothetical protein VHG09_14015 [Longimicrobiales bacterium]|nr:hypothetical protein [Longimicrobiales bacterium]